jgi:AraC-like DNA-binding protein
VLALIARSTIDLPNDRLAMLAFYKKVLAFFLVLLLVSVLLGSICWQNSRLLHPLLPAHDSVLPWYAFAIADGSSGGESTITLHHADWELDFAFLLKSDAPYPFASVALEFQRQDPLQFTDLSMYSSLSFEVRCRPRNVMQVSLQIFDPTITKLDQALTFRNPAAFFSCDEQPRQLRMDLRALEIPEWWLRYNKLELSNNGFDLRQVLNIAFTVTSQSPLNVPTDVVIDKLVLEGRQWWSIYVGGALGVLLWLGFLLWFLRQYKVALTANIQEKMLKDRPLIAYQQLSIEPHNDREKSAVLKFMSTEYSNPELSVEVAVNALGISRNKINDILKNQLGMTFNVYLNKLRLTEAARLLTENKEANITEIAYSVGYNNVSYFNKLFKNEYGCTPKVFKNLSQSDA